MKYKIEFNYRYGKDYEYREDEQFVQILRIPTLQNGHNVCSAKS